MTVNDRRLARAARRAATLDNMKLAEEVKRHASVAARHRSNSEAAETQRERDEWAFAAEHHEIHFLAEVDEARVRLAANDLELPSYLALFGATALVEA